MGGKPNPGGPEPSPSVLDVAHQGRLPGGGGRGAHAVLGRESPEEREEEEDVVPSTPVGLGQGF